MADFKIDGRMTVRKLKENFKNEFEGTLRVYNGRELADDKATLAAIRKGDAKGGEFVCRASRTVGKFEQEMKEVFGIRVQVASPDDYVLALDGITLANLKNIKEKATKADMEELVAYKRKVNEIVEEQEEENVEVNAAEFDNISADEIARLESFDYTFTPDCRIEDTLKDPNDECYLEGVFFAWAIVSDIENGEYVQRSRESLSLRKTNPDGAYIHYEGNEAEFMVVVVDGKIISVITKELYERAYDWYC